MPRILRAAALPLVGKIALPLALCVGLAGAPFLLSSRGIPQDGAEDAREIRRLVDELQGLRSEQRLLEEDLAAQRTQFGEEIARLRDDLEIGRARAVGATELSARRSARIDLARKLSARIEAGLKLSAGEASQLCKALGASIAEGIPFQREERAARLALIATELTGEPEERARGLVELLGVLSEELRLAETTEERSIQLELPDGRRVHAYVVRLGLLQEAFVTEDGVDAGLSVPGGTWRTDLNAGERAAVENLVASARGHRAAELVPLPLTGSQR
ncbi:MAG: hypothetical protein ACI8QS_001279 [Planctomycetota bacterium]|jgi:hypothetical protein